MSSVLMQSWEELGPRLVAGAGAVFAVVAIALIPVVVLRRKEPSSTIAWILTLIFLPVLGAVLFLLFGRDRVRWPAKRKRQADALMRSMLRERTHPVRDPSFADGQLTELEKQIFQVGSLLTGSGA